MSGGVERQASVDQEAESLAAALLRAVPLTAAEADRARAIVRSEVAARRAVPPPPPEAPWAAWDRGTASMAERDAALGALLATDAQRAALAENVAAQRRFFADLRRRAEEQYRPEHPAG